MVTQAIDWYFTSAAALFNLVINSWLLAAFLFVSILYMIARLVIQVRNK